VRNITAGSQSERWLRCSSMSISSSAPYVTQQKVFFPSKFSYLLFCNPTHKTKTGTANRWGSTNSKPPGPIIMMGQSETVITSRIIFYYTLFWRCTSLLCHSPATANSEPNRHILTFLHPIVLCRITYWAPLEMLLYVSQHQVYTYLILGQNQGWGPIPGTGEYESVNIRSNTNNTRVIWK
jgi:hypothetical protein